MRFGVGNGLRGLAAVAVLTGLTTGCGEAGKGSAGSEVSAGASATAKAPAVKSPDAKPAQAVSGGSVGADGSACELPVTFDTAKAWKAKAVAAADQKGDTGNALADELADALLHQGPVTMACELDAKPAGNIGFLRVWTGKPGRADARTVLEQFVADEPGAGKARYSAFKVSGLTGAEVEFSTYSEIMEESKKERALAVTTPDGPVVLHLGGLDTEEHEEMLPAFELAKRTLKQTA
ncbi:lipoprotein [Streptomyces sp. NPDC006172]|uniref:lipoprotein n=1 Tax=Streptomyces sp. NPDC006172 TaxID=3154470 RepID=UPI0033C291D8